MAEVAAIILAAGRGTRFGTEPKMLARLDGKALVRHVTEAALASGLSPIGVVSGHRHEDVETALADLTARPGLRVVHNPHFAEGLSTSLQAGAASLGPGVAGAFVLLGDMPRIGPRLIAELASAWESAGRPAALVPTHAGRRGNPVLLGRPILDLVGTLSGDAGAGALLKSHPGVVEHPVDDASVLVDIDTPDALRRIAQEGDHRSDDGTG